MNKILIGIVLIVIVGILGFFITTMDIPEPIEEDPIAVAEEWILENATTYTQREGSNLEYVEMVEEDEVAEITFSFDSAFAGYGPVDEEEMYAQVITPHTIVVTVENNEVVKAITDGEYDEINQEFVEEEEEDEYVTRSIYFYTVVDGQESVVPVEREILAENQEENALKELISGPGDDYSTAIAEGTAINSFSIENGVAYVDFSAELDVSGSAAVMMVRNQIESTLLQFETIDEVVISINGETEEILQP